MGIATSVVYKNLNPVDKKIGIIIVSGNINLVNGGCKICALIVNPVVGWRNITSLYLMQPKENPLGQRSGNQMIRWFSVPTFVMAELKGQYPGKINIPHVISIYRRITGVTFT
jgi:hypothetical protein